MPQDVKSILVSQPKPESDKNPYYDLSRKYRIKIDFRPFIYVDRISTQEFRKQKVNILDHTAVIFTSRNAVDHFFHLCKDLRITVPDSMKYFCISESTAYYMQNYVTYRKRRIFHGNQTVVELAGIISKHENDKFLLPCSDILKEDIPKLLKKHKIDYSRAVFYRTMCSDLSDLAKVNYDMLVFFSPSGIKSLFKNFPDFKQNETRIAAFGSTTSQAVKEYGLNLDIQAPTKNAPSMTMAIEQYLKNIRKK